MSRAFSRSAQFGFERSPNRARNSFVQRVASKSILRLRYARAGFWETWYKTGITGINNSQVPDPLVMIGNRYRTGVFSVTGPDGSGTDEYRYEGGTNYNVSPISLRNGTWPVISSTSSLLSSSVMNDTPTQYTVAYTYSAGTVTWDFQMLDPETLDSLYAGVNSAFDLMTVFSESEGRVADFSNYQGVTVDASIGLQADYVESRSSHTLSQSNPFSTTFHPLVGAVPGSFPFPPFSFPQFGVPCHIISVRKSDIPQLTGNLWRYRRPYTGPTTNKPFAEIYCERDYALNGLLPHPPLSSVTPGYGYQSAAGFVFQGMETCQTAFPPATWPYPIDAPFAPSCMPEFS